MGPRNLLILFFSTVAVSLVILIIFFSLFFKNIDLNFNTKTPQSAPNIENMYVKHSSTMNPDSKAEGLMRSTVNVPPEITHEAEPARRHRNPDQPPADVDLPPVSDDSQLNDDPPIVPPATENMDEHDAPANLSAPPAPAPRHRSQPARPLDLGAPSLSPSSNEPPSSAGPPVPGQ